MRQREIQHLFWRAGFGLDPARSGIYSGRTREELVNSLFDRSVVPRILPPITPVIEQLSMMRKMNEEERKSAFRSSGQNILAIGINWLDRMVNDEAQLRERMTLFWHDHFASSDRWDSAVYRQNNTLRAHALGSFRTLLKAMCRDAVLLKYLDNDNNRKQDPNENFTRELLELFTLGEGQYSEHDIREGARAFTGHGFDLSGNYLFRPGAHDYGLKTFMGKSGRFDGDDIVDIILDHPQTARYICEKVYRYFVNDKVDEEVVESLADAFFLSDYDITELMRTIFLSDWFYDAANIGSKIKSPVDLMVGIMKHCSLRIEDPALVVAISKILGQTLLFPPNVAGWPVGRQWIDNSNLLFRMRLADFLILGRNIELRAKEPIDLQAKRLNDQYNINENSVQYDLEPLIHLAGSDRDSAMEPLIEFLLVAELQDPDGRKSDWLKQGIPGTKGMILNILRLPEYQLC